MALAATNFCSLFRSPLSRAFLQFYSAQSSSSQRPLQESIRAAVEAKTYHEIPQLLNASKLSHQNPNPFSFLSARSETHRFRIIDEILQSFIPIRPRSLPRPAYSSLLSYTLESPNPLPLALAIVQRTLRSGCLPVPQTHLLLSKAWLDHLHRHQTVASILSEMRSIGYSPDCGTCNYLIQSLCKVDHVEEAIQVLRGMGRVGCIPDLDSFGILITEMSELRMTSGVVKMVKEMVSVHALNPRKETILKAVGAMRANRDIWRAVEMIEFLESEGVGVDSSARIGARGLLGGSTFRFSRKVCCANDGKRVHTVHKSEAEAV
ncbi:hypothetical protein DH2020_011972 [Rehmannia glutinosa]|uniref:Pentatricopeptide repeat-containing protein n=1 Tax=Rehmannia glutinosa TaxID=99300 RepID=A0ABR0XEZ6_REHGL